MIPLLSIILIHILEWPAEAIEALLKNTIGDFEVIVVLSMFDKEVPKLPENVNVLTFKDRVPVCNAYNIGIEQSKGDFITMLGGDMVALPKWNAHITLAHKVYPDAGYVSGICLYNGQLQSVIRTPGAVFNAKVLRELKLDPEYATGSGYEDTDLQIRVLQAGYKPVLVNFMTFVDATQVPTDSHKALFGDKVQAIKDHNGQLFVRKHRGNLLQTPYVAMQPGPIIVNNGIVNPNSEIVPTAYGALFKFPLEMGPWTL